MASDRAVRLWQEALRQLEGLPTEAGSEPATPPASRLFPLPPLDEFLDVENIGLAVWSRLVDELQIPLKLGQAAASARDPCGPKGYAAVCALGQLLDQAGTAVRAGDSLPGWARSIGQQLQRSGFMAALPRLLEAAAAALAGSQQEPDLAGVPQNVTRTSSHTRMQLTAAARHVLSFQNGATWLLQLLWNAMRSWPQVVDIAAVALPALRLCAAAMQHCCRCADALPADAPAPTALEQLMRAVVPAGTTMACEAWLQQEKEQGGSPSQDDSAVLQSPDAMRAVCMLLMVHVMCPEQSYQKLATGSTEALYDRRMISSSAIASASLAAWKFACAHDSDVSQLQQQALQALGCSSRALVFAVGHALIPVSHPGTIPGISQVYLTMVQSRPLPPQLKQQEQVQQLAESLSKLGAGDTPPDGSSPMLPSATLLWLMPAVLLEWAGRQPADGPDFAVHYRSFSTLLWASVELVLEQHQFGSRAERVFFEAAGGEAGMQEERQAMIDAMRSLLIDGAPMACIEAPSMRHLSPMQAWEARSRKKLFQDAGKAAVQLQRRWEVPAAQLAELLRMASGAAAVLTARLREAPVVLPEGGTSAGGGSSRRGSPAASCSLSSGHATEPGDPSNLLREALLRLTQAVLPLQQLSISMMWNTTHKPDLAACRDVYSGMDSECRAFGIFQSRESAPGGIADDSSLTDEEQASMASLCAALQQTLPQLASLAEAAVRTGAGSTPQAAYELLRASCSFLQSLTCPPLFMAAGLAQTDSPALKPLCSLATTVLKLLSTTLSKPNLDQDNVKDLSVALGAVSNFTSLVLQVACVSSNAAGRGSGTSSAASSRAGSSRGRRGRSTGRGGSRADSSSMDSPDRVIVRLQKSSVTYRGSDWDIPSLSYVSHSAVTAASQSEESGSGSSAAVAVVPWLVSLGRCCLGYASLLQHPSGTSPAEGPGSKRALGLAFVEAGLMLPGWLQSSGVSAQLSAVGFNTAHLVELLQSATQAQLQGQQADQAVHAAVLEELGLALSSMPVGTACNNPLCCVLEGPSELQLVVGRARLCAGCRVARYCCRACQAAHWKQHKLACKAVAAARAAAACADPGAR